MSKCNKLTSPSVGEDVEELELSYTAGAFLENIYLPRDPAIYLLLDIYLKERESS